jgi:hypothetical protein
MAITRLCVFGIETQVNRIYRVSTLMLFFLHFFETAKIKWEANQRQGRRGKTKSKEETSDLNKHESKFIQRSWH